MSALDVADDEDLGTLLRVELNGSVDLDKEAAFLRVCVDVFCFMSWRCGWWLVTGVCVYYL